MIFDKKNEGSRINFVLLEAIGRPVVDKEIDRELFIDSFKYYNNSL
jgi:3-dehydroquinate synthase